LAQNGFDFEGEHCSNMKLKVKIFDTLTRSEAARYITGRKTLRKPSFKAEKNRLLPALNFILNSYGPLLRIKSDNFRIL